MNEELEKHHRWVEEAAERAWRRKPKAYRREASKTEAFVYGAIWAWSAWLRVVGEKGLLKEELLK